MTAPRSEAVGFRSTTALIILITLYLAACASTPVGTMWKLKRMGLDGVTRLDPAEILAAVHTSDPELLAILDPSLIFRLTRDEDILRDYSFRLQDVTEAQAHRLDRPDGGAGWRIFALDESEHTAFSEMTRELAGWAESGEHRGSELTFVVELHEPAEPSAAERLDRAAEEGPLIAIDLQLFAEDGFFTLLKPTPLVFDE